MDIQFTVECCVMAYGDDDYQTSVRVMYAASADAEKVGKILPTDS